ncbi:putative isomerase YbhE [Wilcoxina mikolae CBS 423.85]|nr:putative isomerase YbhE [Wilcoxina mikolae CBS 423.85]
MASPAAAALFFVGTYSGEIASVNLDEYTGALKLLSYVNAPSSSWQGLSPTSNILYSIEENLPTNSNKGGVTSYSICPNGTLAKLSTASGLVGPVSLSISHDGATIFTANYGGSGVSLYKSTPGGTLTWVRDWTYTLSTPGANPDRQEAPHPHQALFDPTGEFVVVPDLGADLLRVFSCDGEELPGITVPPGTGPRHGAFFPAKGKAEFYYLVGELSNTVSVFSVSYGGGGIHLSPVQRQSTLPATATATGAAEIIISPDGRFIYVSNRGDNVFSDGHSIAAYERGKKDGKLELLEYFSSKVQTPRNIALDPTGRWFIAEGQNGGGVKVFRRDQGTGRVNHLPEGTLEIDQPVCVTFARM